MHVAIANKNSSQVSCIQRVRLKETRSPSSLPCKRNIEKRTAPTSPMQEQGFSGSMQQQRDRSASCPPLAGFDADQ